MEPCPEGSYGTQMPMGLQLLSRCRDRLATVINREPIDFEYLHHVCHQELQFLRAAASYMEIPECVVGALQNLLEITETCLSNSKVTPMFNSLAVVEWSGNVGRPRLNVSSNSLCDLLSLNLPLTSLSDAHGISRSTIYRRMQEHNLSVRKCFSDIPDSLLDQKVRAIKVKMPDAGYRLVKGSLQARGYRLTWRRVKESLQRVDGAGIISRMVQLSCIARRTYSVPGPLSLVHIYTNHKLIRYSIVVFGGIDGFSRKIMYLNAAGNNKAETALRFFTDGVTQHGWPLRVERLWRDVWSAVTSKYYTLLHNLEEEGFIDLSDAIHLFCLGYVFIPRLQADLQSFVQTWNCHPLSTEGNLTPDQLWRFGMLQVPVPEPELTEILETDNSPDVPDDAADEEYGVTGRNAMPFFGRRSCCSATSKPHLRVHYQWEGHLPSSASAGFISMSVKTWTSSLCVCLTVCISLYDEVSVNIHFYAFLYSSINLHRTNFSCN